MPRVIPSTPPACSITGEVSMPGEASPGAFGKIALNTVLRDTHGWWNVTTMRYVPQLPGRYAVSAWFAGTQAGQSGSFWDLLVRLNTNTGGQANIFNRQPGSTSFGPNMVAAGQLILNGTTDYLELHGGQSPNTAITGTEQLDIVWLGPN